MSRILAFLLAVASIAVAGFAGAAWIAGEKDEAAPATVPTVEPLKRLSIIFPEGFTVDEMTERVDAVRKIAIAKRGVIPVLTRERYERAVKSAVPPARFRKDAKTDSLEGFLFPALYEFTQKTTARELVAKQLVAFRERFAKVDLAYARSKNLTPYDVLIIASMIEKETAVASERRLVSAVIYNRLRNGMPLGIDATLRYGFKIPGTKSLTKEAIRTDSPYNTRIRKGLPPTPIANPGLASLQAAAHPAKVDYLYYVRKPNSLKHHFTSSESDFLHKVCEYGYACN